RTPDWHSIEWKKVWRSVRRLQARIVKAVAEGRWNKVKALVYLLTHSFGGRALAILRVVSNSSAKTPGVDGVLWDTPEAKSAAFATLRRHGIDRNRFAGCISPRATASGVASGFPPWPIGPCKLFTCSGSIPSRNPAPTAIPMA